MTGKTKAAMPGRQCNTALLKHRQITRLAAGGQTLSQRNPYAQINRVRLTYGHRNPLKELDYNESLESAGNKHEKYSGSPEHQHCLGSAIIFRGCIKENQQRAVEVPTNNVESCNGSAFLLYEGNQQRTVLYRNPDLAYERVVPQSHEVNQAAKRYAENNPSLRGAVHSITESNPVQLSGSDLAFLRWRRLISPCIAELINCPVLSPGFFTASMPSMISCAIRAVTDCDFAFFEPVAMSTFSKIECKTLYTKNYCLEVLTCKTLVAYCVSYTLFELRCVNSNAPDCWSSTEASNHNVRWSNIMACIQHTQTRPKYQYRFLALSAIGRNVIHITATTEREAREQSPAGCVMVFAGRLPVEVRHA